MKRRLAWVLVALVLASAVVVMLRPTKPEVRQKAELSFLYFTNNPWSHLAVYAVHFPINHGGSDWRHTELDHWEDGKWRRWIPSGTQRVGLEVQYAGPVGTVATNGKEMDLIVGFFIPNTNEAWRIRARVEELPPLSLTERLPLLGRKNRQISNFNLDPRETFTYWMTNVVGPAGSRP